MTAPFDPGSDEAEAVGPTPIEPAHLSHLIAAASCLSPQEGARWSEIVRELSPFELRRWISAMAGLSIPDVILALRARCRHDEKTCAPKCSGCSNPATRRDADDVADVCDDCGEASDDQKRDREKRQRRMAEREEI